MDCYTLGQTLAHKTVAAVRLAYHPVHRVVGHGFHAARHVVPSAKSGVAWIAPRITCKPPAGFLAGLAKAAGVAIVGAPLLGSPTAPGAISGVAAALGNIMYPGGPSSAGDTSPAFAGSGLTGAGAVPEASPAQTSPAGASPFGGSETGSIGSAAAPSGQPLQFAVPSMMADLPPALGPQTNALIPTSGAPVAQAGTPSPAITQAVQPLAVPEPPTGLLLATALLVLAGRRRWLAWVRPGATAAAGP